MDKLEYQGVFFFDTRHEQTFFADCQTESGFAHNSMGDPVYKLNYEFGGVDRMSESQISYLIDQGVFIWSEVHNPGGKNYVPPKGS